MPQSLSEHKQILQVDFYENFPASEPRNDRTRHRCVRVNVTVLPDLTSKGQDKVIKRSRDSSSKLIFTQSNYTRAHSQNPEMSDKPVKCPTTFLMISVCESGFSALVALKCK
jgi:hypothetical protein